MSAGPPFPICLASAPARLFFSPQKLSIDRLLFSLIESYCLTIHGRLSEKGASHDGWIRPVERVCPQSSIFGPSPVAGSGPLLSYAISRRNRTSHGWRVDGLAAPYSWNIEAAKAFDPISHRTIHRIALNQSLGPRKGPAWECLRGLS
jgi:hypothetical protein